LSAVRIRAHPAGGSLAANTKMREYVAGRIREARSSFGKEGISQEVLANRLGVATNTISRWETGTYEPTLDDLENLSRALGISILELFPKTEQETTKSTKVDALLRAANDLDESDIEELRRYAEFRKARSIYKAKGKR
jgi:transcriptional regulator with XRE-family HTH domain